MKRLLLIVGMHRSGTSCLTGLLGDAGVWLGPVEKGSPHNVKGNNENRQVMNLNKLVLKDNGGSWSEPPEHSVWSEAHHRRADELLDDLLAPGRTTAMKDPRTLFTGAGWEEAAARAGADLLRIGTFRRPERVVSSLTARDETLDPSACLDLWCRYNEELLALHDAEAFPIVDFDLDDDRYLASVRAAFSMLGFAPPEQLDFFEQDLRHHAKTTEQNHATEAIYERLVAKRIDSVG